MNRLTLAAVVAAGTASVVALTDAVTQGLTGEPSVFTSDDGPAWAYYMATASHGLLFALLAAVLVSNAARIDSGRTVVRWTRRILVALLGMLAGPYLVGLVVRIDQLPDALGVLMSAGFALSFPVGALLGILLLRRPDLRPGSPLLATVTAAFVLTLVLGAIGSDWGHPAYPEVLLYFGVALLGRRDAVSRRLSHPGEGAASNETRRPRSAVGEGVVRASSPGSTAEADA